MLYGRRKVVQMIRKFLAVSIVLAALWVDPSVAQQATVEVELNERKVSGQRVFRVKQGDEVRVRWVTDEEVNIHLHGYNIQKNIKPGQTTEWKFKARATGRFPITSHGYAADKLKVKKGQHGHGAPHKESALIYIEVHPR